MQFQLEKVIETQKKLENFMKTNVVSLASTSSVRRRKFSTSWLPSVSFNVTVSSTTTEVGFFWPTLFAKSKKIMFSNFFCVISNTCYVLFCTENLSDTWKLFNLFIFLISWKECSRYNNKGGVLYLSSFLRPKIYLQCFALKKRESIARHCRNVFGRKNQIQNRSLRFWNLKLIKRHTQFTSKF